MKSLQPLAGHPVPPLAEEGGGPRIDLGPAMGVERRATSGGNVLAPLAQSPRETSRG